MSTLGTGINRAFIYDKNGTQKVDLLRNVTNLRWSRSLNAISEANATVATGQHADCCELLGSIGVWGHSLVMTRNGVRVWEGPITDIEWSRGSVLISAHDVLGWALKNVTDAARETVAPGFRAVDELYDDIGKVFADHNPNVLAHLTRLGGGTGPQVAREVKAYGGDFADQFNEMVKAGANFTTVGRRIVVWPNTTVMARLPTLYPLRWISGDVKVRERGLDLSVRTIGVNDEGLSGVAAGSTSVHPFYGQIEDVVSSSAPDANSLAIVAEQYREAHFPAPLSVEVPSGSVLSCDAPYDIRELVAGSMVNVKIDEGLCRKVEQTQQLASLEVSQDKDGEKVAITVAPVSGVAT
jgi:hypothetical protein